MGRLFSGTCLLKRHSPSEAPLLDIKAQAENYYFSLCYFLCIMGGQKKKKKKKKEVLKNETLTSFGNENFARKTLEILGSCFTL
jgi:hypothetical protein